MSYTLQATVSTQFDETIERTIDALEDEGFGVLCDIDVEGTIEEKLGTSFPRYRILGACNPALAESALSEEITLGALLPCNVVVYETEEGEVVVAAVDPEQLVNIADNDALTSIATEVRDRFERVLQAVSTGPGAVTDA